MKNKFSILVADDDPIGRRLLKNTSVKSVRDPLTSCYNKRYLMQYLPVEISRSKRYHRTMSMVMCDIDHFKIINDTYGHQAGDVVLKDFSFCLKQAVRKKLLYKSKQDGRDMVTVNVYIAGN